MVPWVFGVPGRQFGRARRGVGANMTSMERYSRQVLFAPIGARGQEALGRSRVLLVGCGALGSVLAEILVRAGVGRLTLADRDYVDESNLQRQSLYTEEDASEAQPKAAAAARRLRAVNSRVALDARVADVGPANIEALAAGQDLILDGTDNFETRYLLNDASLRWGVPWVYGACVGGYGLAAAFVPGRTSCLRCVLRELPAPGSSPTCDTAGVIGPIVHLVAGLQAAEALKLLTGNRTSLSGRLVTVDVWENRVRALDISRNARDPRCPACGLGRFEFLSAGHERQARLLCGRNAVQVPSGSPLPVDLAAIAERLRRLGAVRCNEHLLTARVDAFEIALFRDGRSIVRGTDDPAEARRVHAKLIGN
jgi:adenylyltransferase/sulfurtransferase